MRKEPRPTTHGVANHMTCREGSKIPSFLIEVTVFCAEKQVPVKLTLESPINQENHYIVYGHPKFCNYEFQCRKENVLPLKCKLALPRLECCR